MEYRSQTSIVLKVSYKRAMFFTLSSALIKLWFRVQSQRRTVITIRSDALARLNFAGGGRVDETLEHDPRLDIDTLGRYMIH
jgi:hypothetical protein